MSTKLNNKKYDILTDVKYLCKASAFISQSLQKGYDVTQIADGSIIVTKLEVVSVQYDWDEEKGKIVKVSSSHGRKQ